MKDRLERHYQELAQRFNRGQISRRDFLRSAALLGLTLGAGEFLSACRPSATTGLSFDPIETLYGVDYITATPDGSSQAVGAASGTQVVEGDLTNPRQFEWYCGCCGQQFRTIEDLKKHAAAEHAWRLPETKRVDQPTYDPYLVGVERFDEKNTIFSRSAWDTEYQALIAEYNAKAPEDDWERLEGKAITAGAIYVDKTAGSLHPYYPGYFGHIREVGGLYNWDDPVGPERLPITDLEWMTSHA